MARNDDERARRLLQMGSDAGPAGLRPGFVERLRARMAAVEREAAEERAAAAGGAFGPAGDPVGALAALTRPALAFALGAVLLAGAFFAWSPQPSARADQETLAALLEEAPALQALLSGEARDLLPLDNGGDQPGSGGGGEGDNR